ncbi:O-antigen ligase family protein [Actinosynnema pretiosum subsp. pretiosum]|uniref:O-antigen ligase family protein n=1 Tax=Actinosynnema pretiosum subsp. pretiosum TaxID=103721 RepID=A0AA45LB23_9PSEU|nr:O-antigen polymerase [Actinosynnema pretiosum subsp. pretiosum]QUF06611.1 O-antigen ligase family protein [Actinosynnema pretiosum subsp. pretiosum]
MERIRQRADGATLVCLYLLALLAIPARLVLSFVPMTLPPALVVALVLGVLWLSAQMVDTLNMGKGRNALRTAVAIYLTLHLCTYAVATRRFLPIDELTVADSGMVRIVATASVAIFACDAVRTRERLDRVMKLILVCTAGIAFVGLVQFGLGIDLAGYVSIPGLRAQENVYAAMETRSIFRRPTGTTNHPIEYGLVCAMSVGIGAHYVFQSRDEGKPYVRWLVCLALVGLGAMTALSRTAILGMTVAGVVMVATMPKRRKLTVVLVGGGFFLGASLVVPGLFGTLRGMFSNISDDPSVKARTSDYEAANEQIALHPLLGRGFGTFLPTKNPILDNQFLLTMIENGYLGLFALVGMFLAACYAVLRTRLLSSDENVRGMAACLLSAVLVGGIASVTFDLLAFSIATGMVFVMLGLSGAALRIAQAEAAERGWAPAPGRGRLGGKLKTAPRLRGRSTKAEEADAADG